MSTRPRLAELATARLARHAREAELAPASPADEDATIAAIADAIARGRAGRRRRGGLAAAGAILVAAAAVVLVLRGRPSPPVATRVVAATLTHDGGAPRVVVAGERVAVAAEQATLSLSSGTRLAIASESDVTVARLDLEQRFVVGRGSVEAQVAKLGAGERFIVQTSDAEVEVRGTRFVVEGERAACDGIRTRVRVTEGVVSVRSVRGEERLVAGSSWPPCAATPAVPPPPPPAPAETATTPPPAPSPSSPHVAAAPAVVSVRSATTTVVATAPPSSLLVEQNRRYAEATALRRRGASPAAIAAYDRFLADYPASELAESATVERMRLLAVAEPTGAAGAARAYLLRWPGGFARQEATALVEGRR